jgi:hypothetical protein
MKHFLFFIVMKKQLIEPSGKKMAGIFLIGLNLDAVLEEDAVAVLWGRGRPADQSARQVQGHGVQITRRS